MANSPKEHDTSTICDLVLKGWLNQYPPEKTSALQDKYLALNGVIKTTSEKLTHLKTAQKKLNHLTEGLVPVLGIIGTANFERQEFIAEYGNLGVKFPRSYAEVEDLLTSLKDEFAAYAKNVEAAYFSNLADVESTLTALTALRDFYQTLFSLVVKIRDEYFKEKPDRRKPIVRDLYRLFSALAENRMFCGLAPTITTPYLPTTRLDKGEYDSLVAVRRQAEKAATALKKAR